MSFNVKTFSLREAVVGLDKANSVGSESDLGQWKFRTGPCAASIHAY